MTAIRKILIANRAEIAIRVISTAREMGIKTVAIFSEADRELPFVSLADESVCLGEGTLAETYLNKEKLIAIAKQTGADAIHPGYGFLSENAAFCRMVEESGLVFIGPTADVISLMGDKITSRDTALEAGVPLIPGYNGEKQDAATLQAEAEKIGYPVLIKASAGGGGKGMRIVERSSDFADALEGAQGEAQNAFGDSRVFVERYITQPRHIEVQVFSDTHGNHVHLFERECSIQRRHQKIVEESPSPALDAALRERICSTAVNIARHINYRGAGTVEFILDVDGRFYFLEMNTRLQVEHPVTELVTGQDLVKWQIIVAEGGKLPLAQDALRQNGHAIEVRIYAEDPDNNFLPTTGTIEHIGQPVLHNVRFENGYRDGNKVTVNYDPMLAKVAVWADSRDAAAKKLIAALDDVRFSGVKTNRAYLQRVLAHTSFLAGDTFTSFVVTHEADLQAPALSDDQKAELIAAFILSGRMATAPKSNDNSPWQQAALQRFRNA
ncbi:MAG: acetyl-CoA carboxylase biotin carboxylase subunit [Alphaproteobacteria bacterium]|nr:acetyl-CoA carboxylase biotin carboxylase subunit [Alphaproteobacteria bacterium]